MDIEIQGYSSQEKKGKKKKTYNTRPIKENIGRKIANKLEKEQKISSYMSTINILL